MGEFSRRVAVDNIEEGTKNWGGGLCEDQDQSCCSVKLPYEVDMISLS